MALLFCGHDSGAGGVRMGVRHLEGWPWVHGSSDTGWEGVNHGIWWLLPAKPVGVMQGKGVGMPARVLGGCWPPWFGLSKTPRHI